MSRNQIAVVPEKCTGCRNCQLICSVEYTGSFNSLEAYINVEDVNGHRISFTEDCTSCGLCVDYCVYGALTWAEGKE